MALSNGESLYTVRSAAAAIEVQAQVGALASRRPGGRPWRGQGSAALGPWGCARPQRAISMQPGPCTQPQGHAAPANGSAGGAALPLLPAAAAGGGSQRLAAGACRHACRTTLERGAAAAWLQAGLPVVLQAAAILGAALCRACTTCKAPDELRGAAVRRQPGASHHLLPPPAQRSGVPRVPRASLSFQWPLHHLRTIGAQQRSQHIAPPACAALQSPNAARSRPAFAACQIVTRGEGVRPREQCFAAIEIKGREKEKQCVHCIA